MVDSIRASWALLQIGAPMPVERGPLFGVVVGIVVVGMMAGIGGGVIWFVRKLKRSADGEARCGKCGYIVKGLTTFVCPECGSDLRVVGIAAGTGPTQKDQKPRALRRAIGASQWKLARWTALVLVLGIAITAGVDYFLWPYEVSQQFDVALQPKSGAYSSLWMHSNGSASARGTGGIETAWPTRRLLDMHLRTGRSERFLQMDYITSFHFYDDGFGGTGIVRLPGLVTTDSMLDYMKRAGVDIDRPGVRAEAAGLAELVAALGKDPGFSLNITSGLLIQPSGAFTGVSGTGLPFGGRREVKTSMEIEIAGLIFWGTVWLIGGVAIVGARRKKLLAEWETAGATEAAPATAPPELGAATARTLSIMFTDIKDYTSRTATESRMGVMELVRRHRELVQPLARKRGGRIVKTIGDALLIAFESATDAVLGGLEIQQALRRHNLSAFTDRERIELRIAISTGEVTMEAEDVYGDAVNLASRVQQLAGAGEVYFTEATCATINKREVAYEQVGEFELKGILGKVGVYKALERQAAVDLTAVNGPNN